MNTVIPTLPALSIHSVADGGVPNRERIAIVANEDVDLGEYGLMLGLISADGGAIPIRDNMLWFGNAVIKKGDWLFVYTGPGEARVDPIGSSRNSLFSVYWGRTQTILYAPSIVPILFRIGEVFIPPPPPTPRALPQYGTPPSRTLLNNT